MCTKITSIDLGVIYLSIETFKTTFVIHMWKIKHMKTHSFIVYTKINYSFYVLCFGIGHHTPIRGLKTFSAKSVRTINHPQKVQQQSSLNTMTPHDHLNSMVQNRKTRTHDPNETRSNQECLTPNLMHKYPWDTLQNRCLTPWPPQCIKTNTKMQRIGPTN